SWDAPALDDFARPLNKRGRAAAGRMGRFLADQGLMPEVILCSTAQRTRETLALILPHLARDMEIRLDARLYDTGVEGYRARVGALPDTVGTVMVIGHNPAVEDYARQLADSGAPEALNAMRDKYPTGALAVLAAPGGAWRHLTRAHLEVFQVPRDLDGAGGDA
ncbi:MAG: SixA phosphatase family protein, partial [Thalassobaculaceae bacterium]